MNDHYQTLGVERNASPDEIKKAYRRMAGQHHPDKGGDTAMFQKVEEAYRVLSDPQQKQQYDNPNPFGQGHPGGFNFNFGGPGGFHFATGGMDINDIFGQMFGHPNHMRQTTYRTQVFVTLEQVFNGDEHVLNLNTPSGLKTAKIDIPKGVPEGTVLKYENIIPNGILLVEFRTHKHYKFERDGNNLYSTVEIDVLDLIIGTTIKFETISGRQIDVIVNPKTQPNSKLRISGAGLESKSGLGDQYINIKPIISDTIDRRIIDAIRESKQ